MQFLEECSSLDFGKVAKWFAGFYSGLLTKMCGVWMEKSDTSTTFC